MNRDRSLVTTSAAIQQLYTLPIPSGALVIDIRGLDDDDVLATLQGEIKNLASEMNMQQVDHWRYLTSFIEVLSLTPLTLDEIKALGAEGDKQQQQQQQKRTRSITGRFHTGSYNLAPKDYYEEEDIEPSFIDNIPNDDFKRNIAECVQLIDTIRNSRFQAVGDMHKRGNIGPHTDNPKVQVIFLTDAEIPSTLSSAAAYAVYLKQAYLGLERSGLAALDIMIICLNHHNTTEAPRLLINRLRWKQNANAGSDDWQHIDALFLCERYGHNGVRIPQHTQPYLAELLLYALLIMPPRMIRPDPPQTKGLFLPRPNADVEEQLSLPDRTYVVGLNAIEYSGRWGRRYLNYSLLMEIIRILQDRRNMSLQDATSAADTWLRRWRIMVRNAVPDSVDGDVPALHALREDALRSSSLDAIFASSSLTLYTGKKSIDAFDQYAKEVAQTYIMSDAERDELLMRQASNTRNTSAGIIEPATLATALETKSAIVSQLQSWQLGDPEPPLVRAQHEAMRVLSHTDFFMRGQEAVRGVIPRAKQQLSELSLAIRVIQNEQKRKNLKLDKEREDLTSIKDDTISALRDHQERLPLFAGLLKGKKFLGGLTILLTWGLCMIALFIAFAWVHHFLMTAPDHGGSVQLLDSTSFLGIPVFFDVAIPLLSLLLFIFRRRIFLFDRLSSLWVELYCLLALIAYPILGYIVSLPAILQTMDRNSFGFLPLSTYLPFWSNIIFSIALVFLIVEVIYYAIWSRQLKKALQDATNAVKEHRDRTRNLVANYLADSVALELLRRAELTDGNGGPGAYYHRIDKLINCFDGVETTAKREQQLANQRLMPQGSTKQNVQQTKKPNLEIRTEILDVPKLVANTQRLRGSLEDKSGELLEFAEILLRMMGTESPAQIEMHVRESAARSGRLAAHEDQELQYGLLLLSAVTALALRIVVDPTSTMKVVTLQERYRDLDYRITATLSGLQSLLQRLEEEAGKDPWEAQSSNNPRSAPQAADTDHEHLIDFALLLWSQTFWEHKDPEICRLLEAKSITEYLQREGYDPQTVKGMLAARTVITGRSVDAQQLGELFLLMFPSRQGNRFFEDMGLEPRFVSIPDMERLILLYIHQYVARSHFVVKVEPTGN